MILNCLYSDSFKFTEASNPSFEPASIYFDIDALNDQNLFLTGLVHYLLYKHTTYFDFIKILSVNL